MSDIHGSAVESMERHPGTVWSQDSVSSAVTDVLQELGGTSGAAGGAAGVGMEQEMPEGSRGWHLLGGDGDRDELMEQQEGLWEWELLLDGG